MASVMDYGLRGRVALVTGAASGIGNATAELLAVMGARVVASDVDTERGARAVAALSDAGHDAVFVPADVTDDRAIGALVTFATETYGRLDCAANCAGVGGGHAPTHEYPDDHWDKITAVNLRGIWLAMRREIQAMLDQGGKKNQEQGRISIDLRPSDAAFGTVYGSRSAQHLSRTVMIDGKVPGASRGNVAEQDGDYQNERRYEHAKEKFGAERWADRGLLSQRRTCVGIDVRPGGNETPESPIRIQICCTRVAKRVSRPRLSD